MKVKEIFAKTILTKTAISGFDYCINPYVGCGHGCRYCYASFMKRFTGHLEPWGEFIDVKVNAPLLLKKQLKRAKPGVVALSTVTDPYQPIEKKYRTDSKMFGSSSGSSTFSQSPDPVTSLSERYGSI